MVARSEDKPRTVTERINSASKQLESVNRALGRGSPALRDSAGNVLQMNADAPYPLLTPQAIDAAVAFTPDGTIKITSQDTTQDRDMTVRDVTSSGEVHANRITASGQVQADNVGCNVLGVGTVNAAYLNGNVIANQVNVNGATYTNGLNTSSLQVGAAGAPTDRQIMTYDLTATHNIAVLGTFYYPGGQLPPSERSLKRDITDLGDPFPYLDALMPVRHRWLDTEHFDDEEHVGVLVDEMAEADPATVKTPPRDP